VSIKKRILLKLTGEIFLDPLSNKLSAQRTLHIIEQIKKLQSTHQFGVVIGGGNFFRGKDQGVALGMTASIGHQAGMLATMMNGLILKDLFEQHGIATALFCAITCPEVGTSISNQSISAALNRDATLVFTGGTGNPFFTNDTNAIIRGLQIEAVEIWKGTNVDGVYDKDPRHHADAQLLKNLTLGQAISEKLGIMDLTAFALAQQYKQPIRIFNIHTPNALIHAANDSYFGSTIGVR
jgi:uridylate kinase